MMKKLVLLSALMLLATALVCWWMVGQSGVTGPTQVTGSSEEASSEGGMELKIERSVHEHARQKREKLIAKVMNDGASWQDRVPAMGELIDHELTEEDLSQLYAYLRVWPTQREEDYYVVANEIMEVLRENKIDGATYHRELLRLIEDSGANDVMRDYAFQHLTQWEGVGEGLEDLEMSMSLRDEAFLRMLAVVEQPENRKSNFVGTALTALRWGVESGGFGDQDQIEDRLSEVVLRFASDEIESSRATRLTALQVAAEMGLPETAEISRKILVEHASGGHQDADVDLRLSAIASLGLVGGEEDIQLIEETGGQEVLYYAARAAKKRIEGRR